mgnify:FL=1
MGAVPSEASLVMTRIWDTFFVTYSFSLDSAFTGATDYPLLLEPEQPARIPAHIKSDDEVVTSRVKLE